MPDMPETTAARRTGFVPADRFEPECEIGLIALATDHAIEDEVRRFLPGDGRAPLYTTRVPLPDSFDLESLRAMQKHLAGAATRLMPGSKLDVIAYGCTSATAAIGEATVFAEIRKTRPGIACTTPMTAADAALRRLGANRIVLVTPYEQPVHDAVERALEARGFAVRDRSFFGIGSDLGITQVPMSRIADAVRTHKRDDVDAVFIACTALRVAGLIAPLERELGLPVIASNHALAWHALDLAGRQHRDGEGRLFAM
jgi:maleate isomerase